MYRTETSDERVRPRHRAEKHHSDAGGAGPLLPAGPQRRWQDHPLPLYGGQPVLAGGWRKQPWSTSCGAENPRVKQEEARLEPGDGRAEALLLACGFRLAEENTHTARYTCRFETQNWR